MGKLEFTGTTNISCHSEKSTRKFPEKLPQLRRWPGQLFPLLLGILHSRNLLSYYSQKQRQAQTVCRKPLAGQSCATHRGYLCSEAVPHVQDATWAGSVMASKLVTRRWQKERERWPWQTNFMPEDFFVNACLVNLVSQEYWMSGQPCLYIRIQSTLESRIPLKQGSGTLFKFLEKLCSRTWGPWIWGSSCNKASGPPGHVNM